jgi:hypothetical protein
MSERARSDTPNQMSNHQVIVIPPFFFPSFYVLIIIKVGITRPARNPFPCYLTASKSNARETLQWVTLSEEKKHFSYTMKPFSIFLIFIIFFIASALGILPSSILHNSLIQFRRYNTIKPFLLDPVWFRSR